jgi:hypothetical protein
MSEDESDGNANQEILQFLDDNRAELKNALTRDGSCYCYICYDPLTDHNEYCDTCGTYDFFGRKVVCADPGITLCDDCSDADRILRTILKKVMMNLFHTNISAFRALERLFPNEICTSDLLSDILYSYLRKKQYARANVMRDLLECGMNPNGRYYDGLLSKTDLDDMQVLVSFGADVNYSGFDGLTAISYLCADYVHAHDQDIRDLTESAALATKLLRDKIDYLILNGADVNLNNAVLRSIASKYKVLHQSTIQKEKNIDNYEISCSSQD